MDDNGDVKREKSGESAVQDEAVTEVDKMWQEKEKGDILLTR